MQLKPRLWFTGLVTLSALALFADPARAACIVPGAKGAPAQTTSAPKALLNERSGALDQGLWSGDNDSIVGFWEVTFYVGDGPAVYDRGFEQWHSDGTELMVDNAVPPLLGNVCIGVWKQVGSRTVKLRHLTWNWDATGATLAGTFELRMTVTTDRRGQSFFRRYVAESFDLAGQPIPELHAEGKVRGRRITVE
jgi:hypothetical protein